MSMRFSLLSFSLRTIHFNHFIVLKKLFIALLLVIPGLGYVHFKYRYNHENGVGLMARPFSSYASRVSKETAKLPPNYPGHLANPAEISSTEDALRNLDLKLGLERRKMELFSQISGRNFTWNTKNPKRILLVTSWRSGSTFLSRILSEHLATFSWYEPLIQFKHQIEQNGTNADEAVEHLQSLLQCRFPNSYLDFIRDSLFDLTHHPGLQDLCQEFDPSVCRSAEFLEQSCAKFPIQVMKLVRLRVGLVERLLSDPEFAGMKVIHLVRDPRAVMSSRWLLHWCFQLQDCSRTETYCKLTQEDLEAFDRLKLRYPGRLLQVKYEDMAADPVPTIGKMFTFAGLQFTRRIEMIVTESTSADDVNDPLGTKKMARRRIDFWKTVLDSKTVSSIEETCANVMKKLGYTFLYKQP